MYFIYMTVFFMYIFKYTVYTNTFGKNVLIIKNFIILSLIIKCNCKKLSYIIQHIKMYYFYTSNKLNVETEKKYDIDQIRYSNAKVWTVFQEIMDNVFIEDHILRHSDL